MQGGIKSQLFSTIVLLLLSLHQVRGNIWDNLFGNIGAPMIQFAHDFSVTFLLSNQDKNSTDVEQTLQIDYSSTLKSFKATFAVVTPLKEDFPVPYLYVIKGEAKREIYAYQPIESKCRLVRTPSIIQGNNNNNTAEGQTNSSTTSISMDLTSAWRFIAQYKQQEVIDGVKYHKYDISSFARLIDTTGTVHVYAYFDVSTLQLKMIKLQLGQNGGAVLWLNVIKSITKKDFQASDFDVPNSWNCPTSASNQEQDSQIWDFSQYSLQQLLIEAQKFKKKMEEGDFGSTLRSI